jgi:class 3 adenylate cyclase/predicted ATPase
MVLPGHEVAPYEPRFSSFECALLFVDISGFTRLSTLLDPESLSKVINNYFQVLVDKVFEFGGDIQKFAGDALFAEWRASSTVSIESCCEAAGACASSMVKHCADFSVMAFRGMVDSIEARGTPVASLNVHCGLGLGHMTGLHIGDNENRREYLYLGRPIVEATGACNCANLGEVAVSKKFCEVLAKANLLNLETLSTQNKWNADKTFAVVADRHMSLIDTEQADRTRGQRNAKSRGVTDHVDGLQLEALIEYRRLMSLYVHPVVVSNDVAAADNFNPSTSRSKSTGKERHIEDAELRSAYVMFIKPLIPFDVEFFDMIAESNETTRDFAHTMNDIMNVTTFELKRFNGHLRQFIADDKGLVLIATFGLRGSTFPNMVGERALPATIAIYNALYMELGIDSRIGATFGDVYCGAVGGIKRNEYAVMGPSVNLAARLMTAPNNPGILVDDAARKMGSKAFGFAALPPVAAKGYKELVKIFEPLSPLKRTWAKIQPNFVGRAQQIATVLSMAADVAKTPNAEPKLAVISASSGMGKSTLLAHIVEYVRKSVEARNLTGIIIAKHVGNEYSAVVPFHAFGQIFLNLMTESRNAHRPVGETANNQDASGEGKEAEAATQESIAEAAVLLTTLGADLGAPPGFADHVKRLVFGMDNIVSAKKSNAPSLWSMASFLAHAFRRFTQNAPLVILGLDDVHHCDEMSWIVLRKIFTEGHNVLMVATACSATSLSLEIEPDFLEELEDTHLHSGRFVKLEIGCLTKDDVVSLITKTLDMQKDEVSEELLNEVYTQSLGLPLFANEILTKIKNRSAERSSSMTAVRQPGSDNDSVVEIILHRIDSIDIAVRDVLNVAAIIGSSFTVRDMIGVLLTTSDRKEDVLRAETMSALMLAVKEGVLKSDDNPDDVKDETVFAFNHDLWKSTLLGLMLHSRKRDVHRKIAQSMESQEEKEEQAAVAFRQKLYEHWLATGDTTKATAAALQVGRLLEREGKPSASVEIGKKTLQMWGWDQSEKTNVGGIAPQVLKCVGPEDLSNILRLIVALGRASTMSSEFREGVSAFEDALRIMQSADASDKLRDRSIIFPAFTGLSDAIAHGHITQDVYCRYEQAMLHKFLQETRIHGRLIHHIHALYLQMNLYGRQGEFDKAIAVQSVIKSIYKIDRHSRGLCNVYDQDSGALSFSVSSLLCLIRGDNKQALRTCRYVLKELLPKLHGNMVQTFALMYPLILVLKESGYSAEARGFFEKVVVQRFSNCPIDHPAFHLSKIFSPLVMLLRLTDKTTATAMTMDFDENFAWAISQQSFGPELNLHLARLGWSADTVLAEICAALAKVSPDARRCEYLTKHGTNVCFTSMGYLRRNGLKIALRHVQTVHSKLRSGSRSGHGYQHEHQMTI